MLMAASIQKISVRVQREVPAGVPSPFFSDLSLPAHVAKLAREVLEGEREEVMIAFLFDDAQRLLAFAEVGRGAVEASPVISREVFRVAVAHGAGAVVVARYHADGSMVPTAAEHAATRGLSHAGDVLGIPLLDHVVVASNTDEYYSFRQMGTLSESTALR